MKKELILLLVFALAISAASVSAQTAANQEKINLAYNWLANAVSTWPSSTEDNSLALLALSYDDRLASSGKFELLSKSSANECWPSICRIKPTALAVLALNNLKENMETADSWLLSQQKSFTDTEAAWYLQIDSEESANCSIGYDSKSYSVSLDDNKKLSASAGNCLALTSDRYWLSVSKSNECLDKIYRVTCNSDFIASIFYAKGGTLYIPSETFSATAGSGVDAKIQSVCLAESGQCSYEGTLWAAYALEKENKDASSLIPYLLAQKDAKFMPDALLYLATENSEYAENLITSQNADGSWTAANSPYSKVYDTALASLALKKYYSTANVEKAETWMLGQQNSEGSFGTLNKIRDTAIVLYALWPKEAATLGNECENMGYSCKDSCSAGEEEETFYSGSCLAGVCCKPAAGVCEVLSDCSKGECDGEIVKDEFGRTGICEYGGELTCYDGFDNDDNGLIDNEDPSCRSEKLCDELAGAICSSSEICQGGEMKITIDTDYCCVDGVCAQGLRTCAEQGGNICSPEQSCSNLIKASDTSFCCSKECGKKGGLWWLVILLVIAIAVVLYLLYKKGIIKFGGKPKPSIGPGAFPPYSPPFSAEVKRQQPATQPAYAPQIQKQPLGLFRKPLRAKPRKKTSKEEELETAFKELKRISE